MSLRAPLTLPRFHPQRSRSHPQRFVCFSDFIFSDLYVFPISSSAIYMFLRFHPQRFICFSDLILSDLYVFTISSSAIYMFFRSHPQIRPQGTTPGLCCFALVPLVTSAGLPWALLRPLCALGLEMLQNDPLGASWDHFASWRWKCLKTTLWMPPGTTLRAGA